MLVVMEDGNVHALAQALLHLEALGALDVFQIDAAEGGLKSRHHIHQARDVLLRHLDVETINACEFLEQDRLAFHDGLGGQRADVPQTQHRRAIGQNRDEILAGGQMGRLRRILRNGLAGHRHAGRIGQRQIPLVAEWLGRLDLEFAWIGIAMIGERAGAKFV